LNGATRSCFLKKPRHRKCLQERPIGVNEDSDAKHGKIQYKDD
jgi:hypothetical protein